MNYRPIFAALTAAALLLCGCAPQPVEQERPAEEVQQETAAALPLTEDTLTTQVRTEKLDAPEYFQPYTMQKTADGFVYTTMIDNRYYAVQCDADMQEVSKAELTPFAPYDGYYQALLWSCISDGTLYGLVVMQNHSNMNPDDAPENDPDWWDKYNESCVSDYYLCTYAADGTMVAKVKLDALEDYADEYGDLSIVDMKAGDGKFYLMRWNGSFLQLGMDGTVTETVPAVQNTSNIMGASLLTDRDGKLVVWNLFNQPDADGDYSEQYTFSEFDTAQGKPGDVFFTGTSYNNYGNLVPFSGGIGEYRLFVNDGGKLVGIKDDGSSEPLIDWTASDLNPMSVVPLEDGSFIGQMIDRNYGTAGYYRVTRLHSSELTEKQVIRLGIPGGGDAVRDFVQEYNRAHSDLSVQTVDFSLDQLRTAIAGDDAPDLLLLYEGHEEFLRYGSKGVFADLNGFMEQDAEVNRETVVPNVLTALQHPNGALYSLAPTFNVQTLAVKEKFQVPESWTMDDMLALYDGADEMHYYWSTQEDTLRMLLIGTDFTDEMAGTCSFDSPEFVKMLEFCSRYPAKSTCPGKDYEDETQMERFDKWHYDKYMSYKNDQDYLRPLVLEANTGFSASPYAYAKGELGGSFTMAGYPSPNKQGGKITAECEMGILSTSRNQQQAWEFLRSFVQAYQDQNEYAGYSVMEQKFKEQLDDEMYIMGYDDNGKWTRSDAEYYDDDSRVYPLTQAERDALEQYIRGCTTYMMLDYRIDAIVVEEAGKYFSGDCTAEEAAKAIQSRAQLMLSEQAS